MAGRTTIQGTIAHDVEHKRKSYDYRFKNDVLAFFGAGRERGTAPPPGRMDETLLKFFAKECLCLVKKENKRSLIYKWLLKAELIALKASKLRGSRCRRAS
ncbi:hypothetical protein PINS_up009263 [Pythium insidiosum]|nr:hypothetical protein PINS_up009263 [Pythium insidiosum]